MNVYVLSSTGYFWDESAVYVEGVFASYAAMLQYVSDRFTTEKGEPLGYLDTTLVEGYYKFIGKFEDEHGDVCNLTYKEYGVIGEHSVKTDKIEFK